MSERYYALVGKEWVPDSKLDKYKLSGNFYAYVADNPEDLDTWGPSLTKVMTEYCLLFYDNHEGYRESCVVIGDNRTWFREEDELWVPFGSRDEPVNETQPLKLDELKEDEEYETIKDAIQLGLDLFGINISSADLKQILVYGEPL
jgi:hypothetical protein